MKPIPVDSSHFSFSAPIDASWLSRPSLEVAPDLIGCALVRQFPDGTTLSGLIVETEAYTVDDPACHAYRGRTARNAVMFGPAGLSYVYFIYGMYHCLNVVTDRDGVPSAVLIRAVQLETVPSWVDDRQAAKPHRVAAGPGKLCRALKVDLSLSAQPFSLNGPLGMAHRSASIQQAIDQNQINRIQTTRIGISQGAEFPWRWYI